MLQKIIIALLLSLTPVGYAKPAAPTSPPASKDNTAKLEALAQKIVEVQRETKDLSINAIKELNRGETADTQKFKKLIKNLQTQTNLATKLAKEATTIDKSSPLTKTINQTAEETQELARKVIIEAQYAMDDFYDRAVQILNLMNSGQQEEAQKKLDQLKKQARTDDKKRICDQLQNNLYRQAE